MPDSVMQFFTILGAVGSFGSLAVALIALKKVKNVERHISIKNNKNNNGIIAGGNVEAGGNIEVK